MKIKDKRSVLFLFVAMLASSLIIGSYCQTSFKPVELTQETPPQDIKNKNMPEALEHEELLIKKKVH